MHCRLRIPAGGLFFSAVLASSAFAQAISGRVIDPAFNSGIAGVRLIVLDSASAQHATVDTDSLGNFRIGLTRGGYRIEATRIGYRAVTTPVIEVMRRELVEVEIRMSANAVSVEPLVVTARRNVPSARLEGYYRRLEREGKFGFGRFVTRAQMDSFPATYVSHHLSRSGVRVVGDAGNARAYSRNCELAVFLDGMAIEGGMLNDIVVPSDLEGIEIYRSALEVPVEFLNRSGCGAIVMWTREGAPGRLSFWKAVMIGAATFGIGLLFMRL